MKKMFALFALAALTSTAHAQGGMAGMDMTKKVTQVGPHPDGWELRLDDAKAAPTDVNFTTMGPGMHVEAGPAGIYWNPTNTASGTYTISATFGVRSTPLHDAVGLFWGGNDLTGDKESYAYFLVYGDGTFIVKHRANSTTTHTVVAQMKGSPNAAIKAAPANGGSASNKLAIKVGADSVRFLVNDTQVAAVANGGMMPSGGIYGVRVNHNISVHIAGLSKQ